MIPSDLWWNYVPAGIAIQNNLVQQIMAGGCVLLDASRLQWMSELSLLVQNQILSRDPELNWNEIDASALAGQDPVDYLRYYFNPDQLPIRNMILQNLRALRSCCWVRNIPESEIHGWIQLVRELFDGKNKSNFRLVLEVSPGIAKGIGKVSFVDAKIERFDIYYFALSILASERLYNNLREYAATLCAELAGGDVELCCNLCKSIDSVLKDPLACSITGCDESQLKQLVCRAQTRSISPLVDIGRLKLISLFRKRIEDILPQQDDYGNILDDVNNIELRHLVYFSQHSLLSLNPQEKEMLYRLYHARNTISHLDILSYDKIHELFHTLDSLS